MLICISYSQMKGCSKSEAKKESKELLKILQLTEKKAQFGNQLSGGMKRKLCLCLALVGGSKVDIEPFNPPQTKIFHCVNDVRHFGFCNFVTHAH